MLQESCAQPEVAWVRTLVPIEELKDLYQIVMYQYIP